MYKIEEFSEEHGLARIKVVDGRNDEKIIHVDTKDHPEVNKVEVEDSFLYLLLRNEKYGINKHTVDMEPERASFSAVVYIPSKSIYYGDMQWLGATWYVVYEELDKESGKERAHLFNAGEKVTVIEDCCFTLHKTDNCLVDTEDLKDVCVALYSLTDEGDTKKYVVYSNGKVHE